MTQYVIQIQTIAIPDYPIGWLAKSFEVTPENPIPTNIPINRVQVILTNTISYDGIVNVYKEYSITAIYSYDETGAKINCTGAVTDSWPID